jgi:hypothetical protein
MIARRGFVSEGYGVDCMPSDSNDLHNENVQHSYPTFLGNVRAE